MDALPGLPALLRIPCSFSQPSPLLSLSPVAPLSRHLTRGWTRTACAHGTCCWLTAFNTFKTDAVPTACPNAAALSNHATGGIISTVSQALPHTHHHLPPGSGLPPAAIPHAYCYPPFCLPSSCTASPTCRHAPATSYHLLPPSYPLHLPTSRRCGCRRVTVHGCYHLSIRGHSPLPFQNRRSSFALVWRYLCFALPAYRTVPKLCADVTPPLPAAARAVCLPAMVPRGQNGVNARFAYGRVRVPCLRTSLPAYVTY